MRMCPLLDAVHNGEAFLHAPGGGQSLGRPSLSLCRLRDVTLHFPELVTILVKARRSHLADCSTQCGRYKVDSRDLLIGWRESIHPKNNSWSLSALWSANRLLLCIRHFDLRTLSRHPLLSFFDRSIKRHERYGMIHKETANEYQKID